MRWGHLFVCRQEQRTHDATLPHTLVLAADAADVLCVQLFPDCGIGIIATPNAFCVRHVHV